MDAPVDIWEPSDFESHRDQVIGSIKRRSRRMLFRELGSKDARKLSQDLTKMLAGIYGEDILLSKRKNSDDYLSHLSLDNLLYFRAGVEVALPKDMLMHLYKEDMIGLFIGIGKRAQKDWLLYDGTAAQILEKPVVNVLSYFASLGRNGFSTGIPQIEDREHFCLRHPSMSIDDTICHEQISRYSTQRHYDSGLESATGYMQKHGQHEFTSRTDERPHHATMKKRLKHLPGIKIFEVTFHASAYPISVDAAIVNNGSVTLYEAKSGRSFDGFVRGEESLVHAGRFLYYNFGIMPQLVLISSMGNENIKPGPVNPVYSGRL